MKKKYKYCALMIFVFTFSSKLSFAKEMSIPQIESYFHKTPYISPMIIKDLKTWISDKGDQVIAINLDDSKKCNRYFGEIKAEKQKGENPFVYVNYKENEVFGYKYIGQTESGVHLLLTKQYGDGSGVFTNLLFVKIEKDLGLEYNEKGKSLKNSRKRTLLKKIGEIVLGDRYEGKLSIEGNTLLIGKDQNKFGVRAGKKDERVNILIK